MAWRMDGLAERLGGGRAACRRWPVCAVVVALGVIFMPWRAAVACAVCETGDTTLTVLGNEKPYAGRVRLGLVTSHATSAEGEGAGRLAQDEWRLVANVAYAPTECLVLALAVPMVARSLSWGESGHDDLVGLGDVGLRARFIAWRDRPRLTRHLVSLTAGLDLPTAPTRRYPSGAPMILEQQLGSGAFEPVAGLAWDAFWAPWSVHVAALGTWTSSARGGTRPGRSLETTGQLQRAIGRALVVRAGVAWRLDGPGLERGAEVPHAGGSVVSATVDLLLSPVTDLTIALGARIPFVQAIGGAHDEGVGLSLGVIYDAF